MRCYGCLKEIAGRQQYCPKCKDEVFNGLSIKPLSFDKRGFYEFRSESAERISISGVQDKISLGLSSGSELQPTAKDGRYILKPVPLAHEIALNVHDMPANEHLSMQISKQIFGLNTAINSLVEFRDGERAYITKRFDYMPSKGGILKADQEDFASILGYTESRQGKNYKYEGSYEAIAGGIKEHVAAYRPAIEEFYKRIVLNYLIGNADAHLKNFSLLRPSDRMDYSLSPNYDLLYTRYHLKSESSDMAIDLFSGNEETEAHGALGYYTLQDFEVFAKLFDIPDRRVVDFFRSLLQSEPDVYELVGRSYLSDDAKEKYINNYKNRLHKCVLYVIDSYKFKDVSIVYKALKAK